MKCLNLNCYLTNQDEKSRKKNHYQADTNEQNSGENWSDGAEGGGFATMASKSS